MQCILINTTYLFFKSCYYSYHSNVQVHPMLSLCPMMTIVALAAVVLLDTGLSQACIKGTLSKLLAVYSEQLAQHHQSSLEPSGKFLSCTCPWY